MSCTPNDPTAPNFLTHFQAVEDPHQEGKVLYPLEEILLLVLCGVISGADGWMSIALYGQKKGNYIRKCATNMFGPGFPMIIHKSTLVMKNSVSILPANPHILTPRSAFAKLCPPLAHFRM